MNDLSGSHDGAAEPTDPVPAHLLAYIDENNVDAEVLVPGVPMPTVPLAAAAIGVSEAEILKSLVFAAPNGQLVLAIAAGPARIDRRRLAEAVAISKLKLADPSVVQEATGFPAGGVAPIGHRTPLSVVLDEGAATLGIAYGGAGTEHSLLRIAPAEIVRLTGAIVAQITVPFSGDQPVSPSQSSDLDRG